MGVHVEWFKAEDTNVSVLGEGDCILAHEDEEHDDACLIDDEVAVIFDADEAVVLQGGRDRVKHLLEVALRRLEQGRGPH